MPVSVEAAAHALPIDAELYGRIAESGALRGRRVELVDGVLVPMSPSSDLHEWVTAQLGRHFVLGLGAHRELGVAQQGGFVADDLSVPEPDLMVKPASSYVPRETTSPLPAGGPLLVGEVSLSSLGWDLGRKRRLYAAARVPEYWVVDVSGERLIVHRDPRDGDFARVTEHRRGEPVAPARLPVPPLDLATLLDLPG